MRKKIVWAILFFLTLIPVAWAEDDETNFRYQTKATKEGLIFRVPEDMPIESRGGLQVPMQFDEYMYGKFKQMDSRMQRIESKLERVIRKLSAPEKRKQQG